jgi:hypothetical protein
MYEDILLIVCVKWYENLGLQVGDVSLLELLNLMRKILLVL